MSPSSPDIHSQARRAQTAANGGVAPVTVHNASTYRNWYCRCDTCRGAVAEALRRRRRVVHHQTAARGGIVPANVVHGQHCYNYYRCRCPVCVTAARKAAAALRRHRRAAGVDPPQHGTSGYRNYGCRCEVCTAAHAAQTRKTRARATQVDQ